MAALEVAWSKSRYKSQEDLLLASELENYRGRAKTIPELPELTPEMPVATGKISRLTRQPILTLPLEIVYCIVELGGFQTVNRLFCSCLTLRSWLANQMQLARSLQQAVCEENGENVKRLLHGGADPDTDIDGRPLLHYAVANQSITTIGYLVNARCDVNSPDNTGVTPLYRAVIFESRSTVEALKMADHNATSTAMDWIVLSQAAEGVSRTPAANLVYIPPRWGLNLS